MLAGLKRYEEAVALLRRVVELGKDLPAPYLPLGYAEMMAGDYGAAAAHLLRAYELGRPAVALIYLANCMSRRASTRRPPTGSRPTSKRTRARRRPTPCAPPLTPPRLRIFGENYRKPE